MAHWETKERPLKIAGVKTPLTVVRRVRYAEVEYREEPIPVEETPEFVKCSGCKWNAGYRANMDDLKYHLEHCTEVDW